MAGTKASAYVSRFTEDGAKIPGAHGDERRDIVDVRFAGTKGSLDWDVEAMNQVGRIGLQDVKAWAFGSLAGYTLTDIPWRPRLGIQVDAASGNRSPYPLANLKLMGAVGMQWRETTADAVYTQPDIPVAGTGGCPGRYTGTYGQIRADYALNSHVSLALEVVHFAIADAIRAAGGLDSNYVGAEFKYGW